MKLQQNQNLNDFLSEVENNPVSSMIVNLGKNFNFSPLMERFRNYYYTVVNMKNEFLNNSINLGINQGIYSSLSNLTLKSQEKFFSNATAHLIADSAFLAGMIYFECSPASIAAYVLNAGMRYLPDVLLSKIFADKIPESLKAVLSSNYTPTLLGLAYIGWQIHEGYPLTPLLATKFAGNIGGIIGEAVGDKVGEFNARIANPVLQVLVDCYTSNKAPKNDNTNAALNTEKTVSSDDNNSFVSMPSEPKKMAKEINNEWLAKRSSFFSPNLSTGIKQTLPFILFKDKTNNFNQSLNNDLNVQMEPNQINLRLD